LESPFSVGLPIYSKFHTECGSEILSVAFVLGFIFSYHKLLDPIIAADDDVFYARDNFLCGNRLFGKMLTNVSDCKTKV